MDHGVSDTHSAVAKHEMEPSEDGGRPLREDKEEWWSKRRSFKFRVKTDKHSV